MIQIKISNADTKKPFLEVKGHANSAEFGHDLVCAAVSAVVIGGLNNLKQPKDFELKVDEGHVIAKAINDVSAHDAIVIETIICGLKTIQIEQPDYVTIKAE